MKKETEVKNTPDPEADYDEDEDYLDSLMDDSDEEE